MNLVLILLFAALMHSARTFQTGDAIGPGGTALALGYVLVTAFFAGKVFASLRLPKLTGYLVAGVLVGPAVAALVSRGTVERLRLVNGMAVAMIALGAGNELDFRAMRPHLRAVSWITVVGVLGTTLLLAGTALLARPLLPFMRDLDFSQSAAVALVLGVVLVAQSPAVVVALRDELLAEGPVTRTILGVVVVADLVVIVLFAGASTVARSTFGRSMHLVGTLTDLGWTLGGSIAAGLLVGVLVAGYLARVKDGAALFVVLVTFVVAEIGERVHLDPLIVALSAGVLVRNATRNAEALHEELHAASLPVYVLFFAVAGANIHLDALVTVGLPALLFVVVRALGLLAGARLGARLSGASEDVVTYTGLGLLPQAGLAVALALLFTRTFPEFGAEASALTLGVVAINELVAPVAFRFGLVRSGEAGRLATEVSEPSAPRDDEADASPW